MLAYQGQECNPLFIICRQKSSNQHLYSCLTNPVSMCSSDYSGEDLSFLLDSKGPGQLQYPETYGEPQKDLQTFDSKGRGHCQRLTPLTLGHKRFINTLKTLLVHFLLKRSCSDFLLRKYFFRPLSGNSNGSALLNLDAFPEFSCWMSSYTNSEYSFFL